MDPLVILNSGPGKKSIPHPQLHPKIYRVHSETPLGKAGAFKEGTHLLVHFNVQPIRHFIVLKNKRGTSFLLMMQEMFGRN